jgi:hypothetical protein
MLFQQASRQAACQHNNCERTQLGQEQLECGSALRRSAYEQAIRIRYETYLECSVSAARARYDRESCLPQVTRLPDCCAYRAASSLCRALPPGAQPRTRLKQLQ